MEIAYTKETRIQGKQLSTARLSRELTQTELSKKSGVTQAKISRFEKGFYMPTKEEKQKLMKALDWPIGFLEKRVPNVDFLPNQYGL